MESRKKMININKIHFANDVLLFSNTNFYSNKSMKS